MQRAQHTDHRPHTSTHIDNGGADPYRRTPGFTGGAHDATEGLH
jgi:hypothetical protein